MGWEFAVLDALQNLHCGVLDAAMVAITSLGNMGLVWIVLAAVLLALPKTRRLGAAVAISLVLELLLCNLMLKPLVARPRPFDVNTAVELLVARPHDFSFPSGHTGAGFACVGALLFSRSKLWIPTLVLAALMGFTRLYLYVHDPTDVLAGALLGMVTGWVGAAAVRWVTGRWRDSGDRAGSDGLE